MIYRFNDNQQPEDEKPVSNETKAAWGIFLVFSAGDFVLGLNRMLVFSTEPLFGLLVHAIVVGLIAAGLLILVLALCDKVVEIALLWEREKKQVPVITPAKPKPDEPKRVENTVTLRGKLPEWAIHLNNIMYEGKITIGNRRVDIPDNIQPSSIYKVAQARAGGKIATISTVSLHELGISRNGSEPEAQTLLNWFVSMGIIQSGGERRPYNWTRIGERMFPVFSTSPLPHFLTNRQGETVATG